MNNFKISGFSVAPLLRPISDKKKTFLHEFFIHKNRSGMLTSLKLLWKATKCDAKEKKHNNGAVILITVINGISPVKVQCLDTCLIAGWHCPQTGGSSTCLRTPVLTITDCDRNLFSDQQEAASQKHLVEQKPTRKWACCLLTLGPWWSLSWWVYSVNL